MTSVRNPAAVLAIALLILSAGGTSELRADEAPKHSGWVWADPGRENTYAVSLFGGEGTEQNFSDTLQNLFDYKASSDRITAVAAERRIAWLGNALSFDAEIFYGLHHGRERYHEFGLTGWVRWHRFPWDRLLRTSAGVGIGPSYTTRYPQLEKQELEEDRSRILNQFNMDASFALPAYPDTALIFRLQHRSGVFGLINGVTDASNFLTLGIRQEF